MVPTIDAFKCDGCNICVLRCPPQVMGLCKGRAVIITDLCDECGICAEVCPIGAVRFKLPHRGFPQVDDAYQGIHR